MSYSKALVISNYNWNLEWIKSTYQHGFSPDNTFIYDKGIMCGYSYSAIQQDTLS